MEKLLVLDDEPLILKSLEHLFEDDYEVFSTRDGETALELAIQHNIAVILCDERMPGLSGHEFLRRVREVSGATRLMMSGYADLGVLTEAVNSGQIFAYISKPWDPLKLKAQVGSALAHFKLVEEVEYERGLLRALMENIPDLIFFKDAESRFTRVNDAHARNLGARDAAECIGKSNADYFDSKDALSWRNGEEEMIKSGLPLIDRVQQVRNPRTGDLGWWSTTKVPMFDRAGHVSGIAGISRNITALKNTEEMLREQSEHNRMILETAGDAFIGMAPDGSITAWNPQAELTFGWTVAEAMGRRFSDMVISAGLANGREDFPANADAAHPNQPIEMVAFHRDGHRFPVEARVWTVRTPTAFSFNAFVRNITGRRRAEEALRKEAALVELLQSVTVAANRSSSIEETARVCLDRICSYLGWPVGHVCLRADNAAGELITIRLWRLGGGSRFEAFRDASDHSRSAPSTGPPDLVPASGESRWVVNLADEEPMSHQTRAAVEAGLKSGFGISVLVGEKITGILEFFSLRTEQPDQEFLTTMGRIASQLGQVIIRQRVEQELQRAKTSAEAANRAKSEFLTTMSHEMRTPMNAILGMADMLAASSLGEKQRDYVRVFQKAGASLLDLINNLLDFSKVESGQIKLESVGFDLGALLQKLIDLMTLRAHERGLTLTLEVSPDVPTGLTGDPSCLWQVLVNLVGNALKFTERGSVTLRVERETGRETGWLRFDVVDTGIGIAADKTEMIFERFTQADSSTTRKYGGTGLGLAISRGLVELMGGRLDCISEPGKGSTFSVRAPFEIRKETEAPEPPEPVARADPPETHDAPRTACRILIAEDSEYNLLLIQAYLDDCGFTLDVAANGRIAVDKVISGGTDLVLMDMQMPVMDGLDATRAIREWEQRAHAHPVPILALTAHAGEEELAKSLEAGCTEHLTKPIKRAVLLDAIARCTGGKIRITPPKGLEHLVPGYLASVRHEMNEILEGLDSDDCEVVRRLGHQFKGSGAGYGFPEIARVGAAVELASKASNGDEVRSQILALGRYLDRVEVGEPVALS